MAERLDGLKEPACRTEQLFALGRYLEPPFTATAQPIAEAGFELGHLLADARLAQAQITLSSAETATFDHTNKQPQQVQVEIMQLTEH